MVANRRVERAPKRAKVWFGFNSSRAGLAPLGRSDQPMITSTSLALIGRPTLIRVRGTAYAEMDDVNSGVGSAARVYMGIAFHSDLVVTQFPSPEADADFPWLWWHVFHIRKAGATLEADVGSFDRIVVDSKAMRKWPPGSNLTLSIVHGAVVAGTPDIFAQLTCRMLFALS